MHNSKPSDESQNGYIISVSTQRKFLFLFSSLLWTSIRILKTILVKNQTHEPCHHHNTNMARSISSLRSQKDGGSRSSSTSSDSKVSSTCDRESDTSSVNSDSSELQDTSSTYSGNSTDSTTVQVDFDHRGETSPLQPPFSPRMVSEHQSRPKYAGFSNYTHDPRAIYIE